MVLTTQRVVLATGVPFLGTELTSCFIEEQYARQLSCLAFYRTADVVGRRDESLFPAIVSTGV